MIRRPPRSTLFSLHDALPISAGPGGSRLTVMLAGAVTGASRKLKDKIFRIAAHLLEAGPQEHRSEEHTSELQSLAYIVCPPLLAKKTSSFPPPRLQRQQPCHT